MKVQKGRGGLFSDVNYIELPSDLTGIKAHILVTAGKWFPIRSINMSYEF